MRVIAIGTIAAIAVLGGALGVYSLWPGELISNNPAVAVAEKKKGKNIEEIIREAEERSEHVKGVYMTSIVARDRGRAATKLRDDIVHLIDTTELNALVIDIKETDDGVFLDENLRAFVAELREKDVWVIARQVTFKDSSQEKMHPEWYLKRKDNGAIWRDNRGGSWLDQSSSEVWKYQTDSAKAAFDLGFDEVQYDYIRFPSDGNVRNIAYPTSSASRAKHEILADFFEYVHDTLKTYKPEGVISADLFGYVAVNAEDLGIGQRLVDIGSNFDYVSLMVYPSHYYAGFQVPVDEARNLPAIYYPYRGTPISSLASSHPYEIIYRSMLSADDVIHERWSTPPPVGTTTPARVFDLQKTIPGRAKQRPWLQDFDLGADTSRGIYYDAAKVRAQIDAAEKSGTSGWLLWNAGNVYTKEALKAE